MRTRLLCCSVVVCLQIMTWVSATSRFLPPNAQPPGTGNIPRYSIEAIPGPSPVEATYKEMKRIGSTPPNCQSKCYGCSPCVAIQVPTINGHFSLQYSNYFPEGWKCKCGPFFYSP